MPAGGDSQVGVGASADGRALRLGQMAAGVPAARAGNTISSVVTAPAVIEKFVVTGAKPSNETLNV